MCLKKDSDRGSIIFVSLHYLCRGLGALIRVQENVGQLHCCKITRGALLFLIYFFAGDCFLYFRANALESCVVKQILREYGLASGQRINFNKFSVSFSRNVDPSLCRLSRLSDLRSINDAM